MHSGDGFIKPQIEKDLKSFLDKIGLDIKGLEVLDVGCYRGFHASAMEKMGANVWGNDIDLSHVDDNLIPKERQIGSAIEKIPPHFQGKFDVVTAFKVYPHNKNPEDFYQGIAKALKPGGKALIGMDDGISTELHNKALEFVFKNIRQVHADSGKDENLVESANQYAYIVSDPKYISIPPKNK